MGLSFKPNTDDIRDSTSIKIASKLFEKGYTINCFDPAAMDNAKKENIDMNFLKTLLMLVKGACNYNWNRME